MSIMKIIGKKFRKTYPVENQNQNIVHEFTAQPQTEKVKIRRVIGIKNGAYPDGAPDYQNVFLEFSDKEGTEIEIPHSLKKKVEKATKEFLIAQAELNKIIEGF